MLRPILQIQSAGSEGVVLSAELISSTDKLDDTRPTLLWSQGLQCTTGVVAEHLMAWVPTHPNVHYNNNNNNDCGDHGAPGEHTCPTL